jgi:thiamine-monophosphate kinase
MSSKPDPEIFWPETFWEDFFSGYFALAERYGMQLIGGDLSASPDRLIIDSIAVGYCQAGKAVRRDGARVGDAIYLTGNLGASAAGLKLLLKGARVDETKSGPVQDALRAHLKPEPRVDFGRRIGEGGLAHAMIDVSDGLAQDLSHLCRESGVAAIIDFEAVPIAEEVKLVCEIPSAAFSFAVGGGEDFELLLTASQDCEERLLTEAQSCDLKLTRIGEIITGNEDSTPVLLRDVHDIKPLSAPGYDHFTD